jgi:hypothetical protein
VAGRVSVLLSELPAGYLALSLLALRLLPLALLIKLAVTMPALTPVVAFAAALIALELAHAAAYRVP